MMPLRPAPWLVAAALLATACDRLPGIPLATGDSSPSTATAAGGARAGEMPQPVLVALVEATEAAGTLARVGTNGEQESWRAADGVGLTLDQGVLFASRGLGADLYTAETAPVLAAWPEGRYTRTLRHLDGENRIVATRLDCRLTDNGGTEVRIAEVPLALRHATETCRAPGLPAIRNDYWRDGDGVLRQSRQWISPAVGHVTLQRVGG